MDTVQYEYVASDDFLNFEFISSGPKGDIRKVVRYSPLHAGPFIYFNLAFGDMNEDTGKMEDVARSGNNDRDKILNTVAATVLDFMKKYPGLSIYVEGSSPARTRLYQMNISRSIEEVMTFVLLFGYGENGWELFRKNTKYDALLAKKKKL